MKNTFRCYCEGDIERFSLALADMIDRGVPQEVTIKCPTIEWPFMIMEIIKDDFSDAVEQDHNFIEITFAPDVLSEVNWGAEDRELQDKINNLSDDELADFLDDLLFDLEDDLDEDDDFTNDDNSEGAD